SISPSSNTYILSPLSPSWKRKSPGASCSVSLSLRKSSAGFMECRDYKGQTISAKLRLCDSCSEHRARVNSSCPSCPTWLLPIVIPREAGESPNSIAEERNTLEQR